MAKGTGKVFEEDVRLVVSESDDGKGRGIVVRVICWKIDGKITKPMIEKREIWKTEDGDRRVGKAKGLTKFDLLAVLSKITEIAKIMEIPAADLQAVMNPVSKVREAVSAGASADDNF